MVGRRAGDEGRLSLAARVRAHFALKLAVWGALAVGICVPYFGIQLIGWLPARTLPATAIDQWVPFSPGWIYVYGSVALLVPLAPVLATTRHDLARYATGLALLCVPCFVIFLLVPIVGPRPDLHPTSGLYGWIVSVDRPSNSLPSLHAGLAAYSLLYIDRVVGRTLSASRRGLVCGAATTWGLLILYSTLATKQHWLLDLPAGVAAAWVAHHLAWRTEGRPRVSS